MRRPFNAGFTLARIRMDAKNLDRGGDRDSESGGFRSAERRVFLLPLEARFVKSFEVLALSQVFGAFAFGIRWTVSEDSKTRSSGNCFLSRGYLGSD